MGLQLRRNERQWKTLRRPDGRCAGRDRDRVANADAHCQAHASAHSQANAKTNSPAEANGQADNASHPQTDSKCDAKGDVTPSGRLDARFARDVGPRCRRQPDADGIRAGSDRRRTARGSERRRPHRSRWRHRRPAGGAGRPVWIVGSRAQVRPEPWNPGRCVVADHGARRDSLCGLPPPSDATRAGCGRGRSGGRISGGLVCHVDAAVTRQQSRCCARRGRLYDPVGR